MTDLKNRSTIDVVNHHNLALNQGDLEETLLDYREDSFIMTPKGVISGLEAIREFFRDSITNHLPPESIITYLEVSAQGKLAYTRWVATSPYVTYLMASDTFVIEEGKIIMQSFVGYTN